MMESSPVPLRIGLFVDAANLYHSAKHLHAKNVNFPAILKFAQEIGNVAVAKVYVVRSEEGKEESFFRALSQAGFEIREKDLQVYSGGAKKGDWDVGITVDIIRAAQDLDQVILGSGDGDFIPLVEYLQQDLGKPVTVISFARSSSAKLKELVDQFVDLASDTRTYLLDERRRSRGSKRNKGGNDQHAAQPQ